MRDQFSNAQQVRKPAVVSKGGLIDVRYAPIATKFRSAVK